MRSVYDRLDANKSPGTTVIETSDGFRKALAQIQASGKDVSLSIGGGGAYGEASYRIALELLAS